MSFPAKVTFGFAVVLAGAFALIFLWPGEDTQEIEALLRELEAAVKRGDAEACLAHVYPNYDHDGMSLKDVTHLARRHIAGGKLKIFSVEDLKVQVDGMSAWAYFTFRPPLRRGYHMKLFFRRTGKKWWVTGFDGSDRQP